VSDPLGWLADAAAARATAGLHRTLRVRSADEVLLDLAGNDYLGLARDPSVVEAGVDALRRWGAGSTGSRLVTGTTALHAELEGRLAAWHGSPAALVTSTGYAANLAAVTALAGPGTLVVSDAAVHASLVDGCRLSRARVVVVPHADTDAVAGALADRTEERALVLVDGVGSADGDLAPVTALHTTCRAAGAVLLVDDAHALGVVGPLGRGTVAAAGLVGEPDVVVTGTLSKSFGAQGGVVLARPDLVEHLVDTARTFIFDTGLAPAAAGSTLAALDRLEREPALPQQVLRRAEQLARLVGVPVPGAAIVPVVVGDPVRALRAAAVAREHGVLVGCFRPPSVPAGTSRLRLTARADLTEGDLDLAAQAMRAALR